MKKAVIFDMYETLITLYGCPTYFGYDIAKDAGIEVSRFLKEWNLFEDDKTKDKISMEETCGKYFKE